MKNNEESDINSQPITDGDVKPDGTGRDEKGHFLPGLVQPGAKLFKPGESGNPKGGSAKQKMTNALLQAMTKKDGIDEALANVVLSKALKGDFKFMELIFERVDGKILEKAEVNLVDGVASAMTPEQAVEAIEEAYRKRHASNRKRKDEKHHGKTR